MPCDTCLIYLHLTHHHLTTLNPGGGQNTMGGKGWGKGLSPGPSSGIGMGAKAMAKGGEGK